MCICGGLGRTASMVHGMIQIKACSCNSKDWETTRKPELEKILREAVERAHVFNGGMERMA